MIPACFGRYYRFDDYLQHRREDSQSVLHIVTKLEEATEHSDINRLGEDLRNAVCELLSKEPAKKIHTSNRDVVEITATGYECFVKPHNCPVASDNASELLNSRYKPFCPTFSLVDPAKCADLKDYINKAKWVVVQPDAKDWQSNEEEKCYDFIPESFFGNLVDGTYSECNRLLAAVMEVYHKVKIKEDWDLDVHEDNFVINIEKLRNFVNLIYEFEQKDGTKRVLNHLQKKHNFDLLTDWVVVDGGACELVPSTKKRKK